MSIYLHVGRDMTVLMSRDVTDHLQLLLRKSGYYLHTSAEKEVVRTIKEKTCYLALNPQKEEKDQVGAWEEFRLPDGKVMRVCHLMCLPILMIAR
jgi:centractin